MTRLHWQNLAADRLADAGVLLQQQRWTAAYYLTGYAVECGLKACVLVRLAGTPEVVFEVRHFDCWTHDIELLVKRAGLEDARQREIQSDPSFIRNWYVAKAWREDSRYQIKTEPEARELSQAVTDPQHGVLPWIMKFW